MEPFRTNLFKDSFKGSAVHAEGLPPKELAKVLEQAKSMLAIDVNVDNTKGDDAGDASAKEKPHG